MNERPSSWQSSEMASTEKKLTNLVWQTTVFHQRPLMSLQETSLEEWLLCLGRWLHSINEPLKKAYEIQGISTSLEVGTLFAYHRTMESDYAREMDELFMKMPLKEYLNIRDNPYKENEAEQEDIIERYNKRKT